MFDFMFFIKTMVLTVILVSLMQIKAGDSTIEDHAAHWVRTSTLTLPLQATAANAARAISDGANWLASSFHKQTRRFFGSRNSDSGDRASVLQLKRSTAYEREQVEELESESGSD